MRFDTVLKQAAGRHPALVFQVSWANGLDIIRDLSAEGVPLLALDANARALGLRSRLAAGHGLPRPGAGRGGLRLVPRGPRQAAAEQGRPLPDARPVHLAHLAPRRAPRAVLLHPVLPLGDDAAAPRQACPDGGGLARGRGHAEDGLRRLRRRPRARRLRRSGSPASSSRSSRWRSRPASAATCSRSAPPTSCARSTRKVDDCGTLMLQDIVPGGDEELYTLGSYLDAQSRPLAQFTGHKLRQHPPRFGHVSMAVSKWVPELAEAGLRLLSELGYHGVSQVEFKRDPRDGRYRLMEVNARHWMWHSLATACGVNLSLAAYRDAVGDPYMSARQVDGLKWVVSLTDARDAFARWRRGDEKLWPWLKSYRGVRVDGLLLAARPVPRRAAHRASAQEHRDARRQDPPRGSRCEVRPLRDGGGGHAARRRLPGELRLRPRRRPRPRPPPRARARARPRPGGHRPALALRRRPRLPGSARRRGGVPHLARDPRPPAAAARRRSSPATTSSSGRSRATPSGSSPGSSSPSRAGT